MSQIKSPNPHLSGPGGSGPGGSIQGGSGQGLEHSSLELEIVDRGPDWLFVRLHPDLEQLDSLAARLWEMMNQQFIHRLVLEMDEVTFLPSLMMGQLVMLHNRVLQHEGTLRLCGLTPQCAEALHLCRLDQALPHFDSREDAVNGFAVKPR